MSCYLGCCDSFPLLQATDSVEAFVMGLQEKGFGTGEEAAEVELLQKLLQVSWLENYEVFCKQIRSAQCAVPTKQCPLRRLPALDSDLLPGDDSGRCVYILHNACPSSKVVASVTKGS